MSRSYKKHPIIKYAGCKDYKKLYNRRLRRSNKIGLEDIPNGNAYKKMNESWNINDIVDGCTWPEYKIMSDEWDRHYENTGWSIFNKRTEEEKYRDWYKCYKGK